VLAKSITYKRMHDRTFIAILAALAQSSRLKTFRILVQHEPIGLPAGEIARQIGVPQNSMSMHLAVLVRAGLATSNRQGRSIIYRASLTRLRLAMRFLVQNCCGSNAALCDGLAADLLPELRRVGASKRRA
jgi:DNA-binding transcriptional ArsR family regulator